MKSLRKEMIASNFEVIYRMKPITSYAIAIKNILFSSSIDTAAVKYAGNCESKFSCKIKKKN